MSDTFKKYRIHLGIFAAFVLGFALSSVVQPRQAAAGFDLGDLLEGAAKVVGVKMAVDEFGEDINKTINKLMDNNDATTNASSKAILTPILPEAMGLSFLCG